MRLKMAFSRRMTALGATTAEITSDPPPPKNLSQSPLKINDNTDNISPITIL